MSALERYQSIVERVAGKGRATVSDLADHLSVTPETNRRDFDNLEQRVALLKAIEPKILLADSSKFAQTYFSTSAQVKELDLIISDTSLEENIVYHFDLLDQSWY